MAQPSAASVVDVPSLIRARGLTKRFGTLTAVDGRRVGKLLLK